MEKHIYSKKTITTITKKEYTDEIKEIILLDALYLQSENSRYFEKACDLKWALVLEVTEYFGYSLEHEDYYSVCDRIDFVISNYIEEQSSEILEKVLDNIK